MKKIFFVFIFGIFLIGLTSALGGIVQICIDHISPSAPSNLAVTSSGTDIILTWNPATDEPSCSGIGYYVVSRNGNYIRNTTLLTFTDESVPYGTYSYSVYAIDKAGHNSGPAIRNDVVISPPSNGGGSHVHGGGGGSSYICEPNWECTGWKCINNETMTRTCTDTNKCASPYNKPIEQTGCVNETQDKNTLSNQKPPKEKRFSSGITGAVIGGITDFSKSGFGASLIIAIVIILAGIGVISLKKRSRKS